jgi:hypothetical protein
LEAALQRFDPRRRVGRGGELGDDAFDLALGTVAHAGEQLAMVFRREVRADEQDAGEMKRSFSQHGEQRRELASQSRSATAALGFIFGHA